MSNNFTNCTRWEEGMGSRENEMKDGDELQGFVQITHTVIWLGTDLIYFSS